MTSPHHRLAASIRDHANRQVDQKRTTFYAKILKLQPIQVEITKAGVVRKAEVLDTKSADDPLYREVALSARNAVLLSSPLLSM